MSKVRAVHTSTLRVIRLLHEVQITCAIEWGSVAIFICAHPNWLSTRATPSLDEEGTVCTKPEGLCSCVSKRTVSALIVRGSAYIN